MAEITGKPMETVVNWFMLLIIFVFDPLAIAMIVAANMAFAHIKGIAKDPKDYEVYKKEVIIEKEIPIVKEVIKQKIVEVEKPIKLPINLKKEINDAVMHARRSGKKVPENIDWFFED